MTKADREPMSRAIDLPDEERLSETSDVIDRVDGPADPASVVVLAITQARRRPGYGLGRQLPPKAE